MAPHVMVPVDGFLYRSYAKAFFQLHIFIWWLVVVMPFFVNHFEWHLQSSSDSGNLFIIYNRVALVLNKMPEVLFLTIDASFISESITITSCDIHTVSFTVTIQVTVIGRLRAIRVWVEVSVHISRYWIHAFTYITEIRLKFKHHPSFIETHRASVCYNKV